MNRKRKQHEKRKDTGSVLTEMAVLIPVVLLLLIGAVDFSRAYLQGNAAANAAHAGAQYGSRGKTQAFNIEGMKQAALRDLYASHILGGGVGIEDNGRYSSDFDIDAESYCMCGGVVEIDCNAGDCAAGEPSQIYVRVRVNTTYEPLFDYPGIPSEIVLDRQAILRAR